MVYKENFLRLALNGAGNPLATAAPKKQSFQYKQVKHPLKKGDAFVIVMGRHTTQVLTTSGRMSTHARTSCAQIVHGGRITLDVDFLH
jgi:hypothetical protein